MATWPLGLPQKFDEDSFKLTFAGNLERTQVSHGPPKTRMIGTAGVILVSGKMEIVTSQYTTFETFFTSTINWGADPFDWNHPIDGSSVQYQFVVEPTIIPAGGVNWVLDMALEILP